MSHVDEGTLHAYLDGELEHVGPGGAAALEAHLAACDACRARLEEERLVRDRARRLLDHAGPEDLDVPPFDAVLRRARDAAAPGAGASGPARRRPLTLPLAWAASIALALAGGWWARDVALRTSPTVATLEAPADAPGLASEPEAGPAPAPAPAAGAGAAPASRDALRPAGPARAGAPAEPRREAAAAAKADAVVAPLMAEDRARVSRDSAVAGDRPTPPAGGPARLAGAARAPADSGEARRARERQAEPAPSLAEAAVAAAAFAPATPPIQWSAVDRAEAERRLGGELLLVEGLEVASIEAGDSGGVPYVRTRQPLAPGIFLELLQRRAPPPSEPAAGARRAAPRAPQQQAAPVAPPEAAALVLRRGGFDVTLRAAVSPDSLRALAGRLR